MRISLFYNQDAGEGESLNTIRKTLERQGHTVVQVVKDDADLRQLLAMPSDLVVAAGGDGRLGRRARAGGTRDTVGDFANGDSQQHCEKRWHPLLA